VYLTGRDVKGDNIPHTDHIAHYCYGKMVENGVVSGAAFLPDQTDTYLSVNWLEFLKCSDRSSEITEVRRRYAANFNVRKKCRRNMLKSKDGE